MSDPLQNLSQGTPKPSDVLQALLQGPAKPSLFPPNSRYAGIDTGTLNTVDGRTIVYVRRRFVPPPERFALLQEYTVVQGDRLDNLAAKFVGDPELFWQVCDANAAMRPEELTEIVGRTLRITLPEGIPGTPNA
jgi:hypothetical protein